MQDAIISKLNKQFSSPPTGTWHSLVTGLFTDASPDQSHKYLRE